MRPEDGKSTPREFWTDLDTRLSPSAPRVQSLLSTSLFVQTQMETCRSGHLLVAVSLRGLLGHIKLTLNTHVLFSLSVLCPLVLQANGKFASPEPQRSPAQPHLDFGVLASRAVGGHVSAAVGPQRRRCVTAASGHNTVPDPPRVPIYGHTLLPSSVRHPDGLQPAPALTSNPSPRSDLSNLSPTLFSTPSSRSVLYPEPPAGPLTKPWLCLLP